MRSCLRTCLASALLFAVTARAQVEVPAVELDMTACHDPDPSEVRRLLALELRLLEPEEHAEGSIAVRAECDDTNAHLHSPQGERALSLASVPANLRARLLALAIAEVAAAKPVVVPPVVEAPAPAPTRVVITPPSVPRLQRFRLSLVAKGQRSTFFAAGAALALSVRTRSLWAWSSGADFTQGETDLDFGRLRVRQASLFTGPALFGERGRVGVLGGLGVRAGWLGLRGTPEAASAASGRRFDTWYVGPTAFATLSVQLASHVFMALALELTNTVREVHAQVRGADETTLSTWWGSASIGVGTSW